MRRMLLLLLIIPAMGLAEHHRGHAVGFSYDADFHAIQAAKWVDSYVIKAESAGCSFHPSQLQSIEVLYRYIGFVQGNMALVRELMESGDLDDARRKVTRPNGDPPNSADALMEGLMHRIRSLMPACEPANVELGLVLKRFAHVWTAIDRVNWHIQDAIREEIYSDQAFICSGPGNHC